jgi:hypothetical protein
MVARKEYYVNILLFMNIATLVGSAYGGGQALQNKGVAGARFETRINLASWKV